MGVPCREKKLCLVVRLTLEPILAVACFLEATTGV